MRGKEIWVTLGRRFVTIPLLDHPLDTCFSGEVVVETAIYQAIETVNESASAVRH
jgi:hypothetical protein